MIGRGGGPGGRGSFCFWRREIWEKYVLATAKRAQTKKTKTGIRNDLNTWLRKWLAIRIVKALGMRYSRDVE